MRLWLDECVPRRLRRELSGHDVQTVREAGWAGLKNGVLLRAAAGTFYQQNLSGLHISLIVIAAASNDIDDLRPLVPAVRTALNTLQAGVVIRVSGRQDR